MEAPRMNRLSCDLSLQFVLFNINPVLLTIQLTMLSNLYTLYSITCGWLVQNHSCQILLTDFIRLYFYFFYKVHKSPDCWKICTVEAHNKASRPIFSGTLHWLRLKLGDGSVSLMLSRYLNSNMNLTIWWMLLFLPTKSIHSHIWGAHQIEENNPWSRLRMFVTRQVISCQRCLHRGPIKSFPMKVLNVELPSLI